MFHLEFVIPAILLGIVGGFNFNFYELKNDARKWFRIWALQAFAGVIITGFIFWAAQPSIVSPYGNLFLFIGIYWFIGLFIAGVRIDDLPRGGATVYAFFLIILCITGCSGCSLFRHADYRQLIGDVDETYFTDNMAQIDEAKMRIVSKEQAQYLADKVLGESEDILGSRYLVGDVNACYVNGEIIWVAPLEFRSFWKWNKFKTTPGYVLVSAENNQRKAVLVDTLKLKYLSSACFSTYLKRRIYTQGFWDYQLREISFELDDNYKPYFTISATRPSIGFLGAKTEGLIILDPKTGDVEWKDLDEVPDWVDRIIPEELAESYITNWGLYVKGFWNSIFAEEDIVKPTSYATSPDVWFVPDVDGNCYWYTGITSISADDEALTGIMLINTKTGTPYYSRLSGSNEQAIMEAANNALGADGQRWMATQPMPYNIYDELSFLVPIVGIEQPILQRLALVRAGNLQVALGKDKRAVLREYRRVLSSDGNIVAGTHISGQMEIAGRILRLGQEVMGEYTIYYLWLDVAPDKLFTLTSESNPEITIARENEQVILTFINTEEELVQVSSFDLLSVDLQKSAIQEAYEAQIAVSEDRLEQSKRGRDAKHELEKLPPEELEKLLKKHKEKKSTEARH